MQVVIEFEDTEAQRWSGRLHGDEASSGDLQFHGRLDLLRLLESAVSEAAGRASTATSVGRGPTEQIGGAA